MCCSCVKLWKIEEKGGSTVLQNHNPNHMYVLLNCYLQSIKLQQQKHFNFQYKCSATD